MPDPIDLTFAVLRGEPGSEVLDLVVRALDEPDPRIQERAVAFLLERGDPAGFAALRRRAPALLPEGREALRSAGPAFLEALKAALEGATAEERLGTVSCLVLLGQGEALQMLGEALGDPDPRVKDAVARALEAMADQVSLPANEADPLLDRNAARRRQIVDTLLGALRNYRQHGQSVVLRLLLRLDPSTHRVLMDVLASPGDLRRRDLTEFLERSQAPEVAGFLFKALKDPRDRLKEEVVRILERRRGDPAFQKALWGFLESSPPKYLQRLAAESETLNWWPPDPLESPVPFQHHMIGFLREARRLPLSERVRRLEPLLAAADGGVRAQTALLLADLGGTESVEALWPALEDPEETVQLAAVRALAVSEHPQRYRILVSKLNHPMPSVASVSREAVAREGFQQYLSLFPRMDVRTRATAGQALVKLDPAVTVRIEEEMAALDADRRVRALQVLDTLGKGPELVSRLVVLMGDPDRKVRASVVRSLGAARGLEAFKALVPALADPDRRIRANAVEAVGQFGDPRLSKILLPFLSDTDHRTRANAVKALWEMGHREVIRTLEAMLVDPSEEMRQAAVWVAGEIDWTDARGRLAALAESDASMRVRAHARRCLAAGAAP